jgi:hypothetical protein
MHGLLFMFRECVEQVVADRKDPHAVIRLGRLEFAQPKRRADAYRAVFTVLGAGAELERSLIAEPVRAGLRNARVQGRKLGRRAFS